MTGKTHQILGISAGLTYLVASAEPHYSPATFGTVLVFSYLGSLLPDIDQPNGKLWHYLPLGHTIGKVTNPLLEHRNLTHSFVGVAIVATGLHFLLKTFPGYWGMDTNVIFVATLLAYGSHLFADMWTNEGIPLLFPWKRFMGLPPKPFDGIRVATGKWFENLVIFPVITLYLIIFVLSAQASIRMFIYK